MILLRQELGDELRQRRVNQGRTLRQVSARARVSLGYLSEVERGQKEASSELLAAICTALDVPLSDVLDGAAARVRHLEPALAVPEVPAQPPALAVAGALARTRPARDTRPPRGTVAAA